MLLVLQPRAHRLPTASLPPRLCTPALLPPRPDPRTCSSTHKPFNTTARSGSPTAWASRTLRPCPGCSRTSSGSAHADASACQGIPAYSQARPGVRAHALNPTPPMFGYACAGLGAPPIYTTQIQLAAWHASLHKGLQVPTVG